MTIKTGILHAHNGKQIGVASLNNPRALNALTLEMVRQLDQQLIAWQDDPSIACILLRGEGERAFCAGGDVRALRQGLLAEPNIQPNPYACRYLSEEYRLNYRIHQYPKPLLVWGQGIVMGGGMGLLAGASQRILTPGSRVAMPEVSIGLFPDVGGSWFLNRIPDGIGRFLALTGAVLNATDAVYCGLADHILPDDSLDALLHQLQQLPWSGEAQQDQARINDCLQSMCCPAGTSQLQPQLPMIQQWLQLADPAVMRLAVQADTVTDPWLHRAWQTLRKGCPASAVLSWVLLQRCQTCSLADCLRTELTLAVNFCASGDLIEGVRAQLIDKDNQPVWPTVWQSITPDWIDQQFISPWSIDPHPLADLT